MLLRRESQALGFIIINGLSDRLSTSELQVDLQPVDGVEDTGEAIVLVPVQPVPVYVQEGLLDTDCPG